jgi:signal transduction histidine kinase
MKSLGSRLTYWYVLVVSVTVIIILVIGRWVLERELIKGMDLLNDAEYREIVDRVKDKTRPLPDDEVIKRVAAHSKIDAPLYFFQLWNANGEVVFRSANMGDAVLPANPKGQTNWSWTVPLLENVRAGEFPLGTMHLQIAASLRDARRLFRSFFQVSLGLLGVAAVLSIFFGYRLSRLALDPVRQIQRTAQRIGAENLSERIPVGGGTDEISDLSRLLNQMFDRLEISFGRLWRFAAEASHELKTPLSLIRLQSEKLLLRGELSESQQEAIQQQLESIARLDAVIEKLLFLARSEVGAVKLNIRPHKVQELIEAVTEDARALCEEAGVDLEISQAPDVEMSFDLVLLRQVLLNLIANALNATPVGGLVTLSSMVMEGVLRVTVEDTGPGLPANRMKDVFEPFVRIPQATQREITAGTGLGLAICRSILDLHQGTISAENRTPAPGLRIVFEIAVRPGDRGLNRTLRRSTTWESSGVPALTGAEALPAHGT